MIEVTKIEVGQLETNCYLVCSSEGKESIIIDPGAEPARLLSQINGLKVKYIINTHGHSDHIGANGKIKKSTGASLLIHRNDASMLIHPEKNLSLLWGEEVISPPADKLLQGGEELELAGTFWKVIHTPGHSPGGISLLWDHWLFSGDTLFAGSVGRTDLPGASWEVLLKSIREELLTLDDEVTVYPGHGPSTTIGEERRWNPFLQ